MHLSIPREAAADERRVALTPNVLGRLAELGYSVSVAPGAGERAGFPDAAFADAGADVESGDAWGGEAVVQVGPPGVAEVSRLQPGAVVIGLLEPLTARDIVTAIANAGATAIAFETLPRTTLAQSMDALSSQATAAGYAAVLEATTRLPRFFPMLTTAAGTIRPARVLVLGAGVAGLQAIATARRLGAVVSAYDIRSAAKEQVESLGARFVEAPTGEADEQGYAKEVDEDMQRRQLEALAEAVAGAEAIITTAQIPGRPAPLLVTEQMVGAMSPGSVIVDLAAPTGGNCELTVAGETVEHGGVVIYGPTNLPSIVAADASRMYARNVVNLLEHLTRDGALVLDTSDEIVDGVVVVHQGEIRHPRAREAAGMEPA